MGNLDVFSFPLSFTTQDAENPYCVSMYISYISIIHFFCSLQLCCLSQHMSFRKYNSRWTFLGEIPLDILKIVVYLTHKNEVHWAVLFISIVNDNELLILLKFSHFMFEGFFYAFNRTFFMHNKVYKLFKFKNKKPHRDDIKSIILCFLCFLFSQHILCFNDVYL